MFNGGKLGDAEERLRQAIAILEQLVAEHPNAPDYAASEAQTLYTLSELLCRMHRPDEAAKSLSLALEQSYSSLAMVLTGSGETQQAAAPRQGASPNGPGDLAVPQQNNSK